jgi:sulfite reductase beta subunit-like hemoprotein/molybdopterin converting factor small subunit
VSDTISPRQRRQRRPRRTSREAPTQELVLRRNSIERLKADKFPLDIVDELPQLIALGYEAVPEEDIVRLNWWGLTHDKPKTGTFMVRIKVAGGQLTASQLRGVGRISQEWGEDYGELTTRQGLQLHHVRLDELPAVLEAVEQTGLTTVGGEGDTVRNITGCPVAGIQPGEAFDVRPVIGEVADFFWGNREYSNLPRKHKYGISACPGQCDAPEIQDVALFAVRHDDGREGFTVRVGGGLSNLPRLARDLGVFVPREETIEVLRAITDAWQHDLRYRVSRAKARIKFMMDDHGPDGVRAKVEERLGRQLERFEAPAPTHEADHLGVQPQAQEGYVFAGFSVPMGWLTGTQMIAVADLVEETGTDIRLTRQQDLIIGNIPVHKLGHVTDRMQAIGLPIGRNKVYGNSIACTSHRFCNYSVAETKGKLQELLEEYDARYGDAIEDLKIFMDGCPHACAHHWVGDIGLQGTTTKLPDGQRVEAYDVALRGGLGLDAAIGVPLLRRIPTGELNATLDRLIGAWVEERLARNGDGAAYTFRRFLDERDDDELTALAIGADGAGERDTEPLLPIVRVPGTLLELSEGADEVPVAAATVREALARLGEAHPRLTAELLHGPDEVNRVYNLYVGEDDIRSLGGLDAALEPGDELLILPALAGG